MLMNVLLSIQIDASQQVSIAAHKAAGRPKLRHLIAAVTCRECPAP